MQGGGLRQAQGSGRRGMGRVWGKGGNGGGGYRRLSEGYPCSRPATGAWASDTRLGQHPFASISIVISLYKKHDRQGLLLSLASKHQAGVG